MALQDDNTLVDDREPVTILGIRRENLPLPVDELRERGTNIKEYGSERAESASTIDGVNRLERFGFITAQQARRRKKRIRDLNEEITEQFENTGGMVIQLKYDQPNVSVDSTTRFTEYETIDGPIVRQRIGPGLVEVSIEGVCTTAEAAILDNLRHEDTIEIISERYNGQVQIAAASTSPLEDGGALDLDGQFTHTFGIELVEVER